MSVRTPLKVSFLTPAFALLAVVLAGCGVGSKSATASPSTTADAVAPGGGPNRIALNAFRACMAKNGSPLPSFAPPANNGTPPSSVPGDAAGPDTASGSGNGAGPGAGVGASRRIGGGLGTVATSTDPAVQKAFAACKATLPAGFLQQQQQAQQQRLAFNSCMKDHGVTLRSEAPATGETTTTIDRNSPAYTAAFAVCGQLLPQRPNRTTTTTATAQ